VQPGASSLEAGIASTSCGRSPAMMMSKHGREREQESFLENEQVLRVCVETESGAVARDEVHVHAGGVKVALQLLTEPGESIPSGLEFVENHTRLIKEPGSESGPALCLRKDPIQIGADDAWILYLFEAPLMDRVGFSH
jgi:hypothetical protein